MEKRRPMAGAVFGDFGSKRRSADEEMHLVGAGLGRCSGGDGNAGRRQPHFNQGAQHAFGLPPRLVGVERDTRLAAGGRRHGDEVEDRVGAFFQNPADGVVERLLVGNVVAVEADYHQRAAVGGRDRRAGRNLHAAAGVGHGDVHQAAAVDLAGLDAGRHQVEVGLFGGDVVGLAAHVAGDFGEQPVDQHVGAVDLVFEDGELAVVLVNGAGDGEGGLGRFGQERRHGRARADGAGELVHFGNVLGDAAEVGLGTLELLHQDRVARRGADLQARVHRGDGAVITARVADQLAAQFLQLGVLLGDVALQALQFVTQFDDLLADEGAGGRARRDAGGNEVAGAERRLAGRRRLVGGGRLCRLLAGLRLLAGGRLRGLGLLGRGGGILACERRPKRVFGERTRRYDQGRADGQNPEFFMTHSLRLP